MRKIGRSESRTNDAAPAGLARKAFAAFRKDRTEKKGSARMNGRNENGLRDHTNDKFPRDGSSGNGTTFGWSVEARMNYHEPTIIFGRVFDKEWRHVPISEVTG